MSDVLKGVLGGVVLGAFAFFTGGAGIGLLGTTTLLGSVGVGAALGGLMSIMPKPKIPDLSSEFGREIQLSGDPLAPRKVCYGEAWTAGVLRYHNTDGDNNEDLYLVIVLAGTEIDSVQAVEVDGTTVTIDSNGDVTTPSKWSGLLNIRFHLGADDQTADTTLVSLFSDHATAPWTTDHRLRGLAYAIVKLTFDEEDMNTPPQMRFKLRGRKVYDPRKDDTQTGGDGDHRLSDPSTWEWSQNAVLCARDFARGVYVNSRAIAGMRVDDTRFVAANVIAEANVCDEDVELADESTQNRYEVDGFIDPRQDHGTNLRHFEVAMGGDITFADGKWRFFAGAYRAPTLHLQDRHFIGPLQHIVHKGESSRVDTIQGVFASASDSGDVLDYPPISLDSATSGEERMMRMDFALVSDGARAQRCAKLLLEREAAGKRITCTTNLYGLRAVPGETINITHAAFGLSTQAMRVLDVELSFVQADEGKLGVVTNLVLEAGPSSLYTWDAEETAIAASPTIPKAQVPFPTFTSSIVVTVYQRASSAPSTPAQDDGSYNFTTKSLTAPTGWTASVPASDGNPLYATTGIFQIQGSTGTAEAVTWTTPVILVTDGSDGSDGDDGDDGTSSFVAQIYRRATSQPATPTGGSYNFGTGALTAPTNWTQAIPTSTGDPLWVSHGLFAIQGTTGTDNTVTWTAPSMVTEGTSILLGNGLVNPGAESGTLVGWTAVNGTWSASTLEPRFGTYSLFCSSSTDIQRIVNNSRLQVTPGDRVLAMGFVQRGGTAGAEDRQVLVRINWRDSSDTNISVSEGNAVTATDYQISRIIATAPANAATAVFEFYSPATAGDAQPFIADGAYMAIIPRGENTVGAVSSQPVDGTLVIPSINVGGSQFVDSLDITTVSWTNDTGVTVDVIVRYSGLFALASSDSLGVGHFPHGRYDIDGGSDTSDGDQYLPIENVDPEFLTRSGQFIVSVDDGEEITAAVCITLVAPALTNGNPSDVDYKGVSISIEALLEP